LPLAAQSATSVTHNGAADLPLQATPPSAAAMHQPLATRDAAIAHDSFATLDADAALSASSTTATWTHASAHSLEAGFEDPALGWIGVRAGLGAGSIHAALVPGTAEAAQTLGSQISGLHAYLTEQRTPVSSLTLAMPDFGASFAGGNSGAANQGHNPQQNSSMPAPASPISGSVAVPHASIATEHTDSTPHTPLFERAGADISVLA
jgi:hypothetical protein